MTRLTVADLAAVIAIQQQQLAAMGDSVQSLLDMAKAASAPVATPAPAAKAVAAPVADAPVAARADRYALPVAGDGRCCAVTSRGQRCGQTEALVADGEFVRCTTYHGNAEAWPVYSEAVGAEFKARHEAKKAAKTAKANEGIVTSTPKASTKATKAPTKSAADHPVCGAPTKSGKACASPFIIGDTGRCRNHQSPWADRNADREEATKSPKAKARTVKVATKGVVTTGVATMPVKALRADDI